MAIKPRHKGPKTFSLQTAGRPSRQIEENQLVAQFANLDKQGAWRDILLLGNQLGEQRYRSASISNYYLKALEAVSQHQALLTETQKCLEKQPRNPAILSWRAHALRLNGQVEESIDLLRRAIKFAKPDAGLFNTLGSALKEAGDFTEARTWFDRAINMQGNLAKAHWNRSDLVEDPQSAIDSIEKVLKKQSTPVPDQHLLHFSLYRHYEKLGDFEQAFENLSRANSMQRAQLSYDSSAARKLTDNILSFFNQDFDFTSQDIDSEKQPVFIFGLPRSGTTLVEHILASHPEIQGGNELTFLNDASAKVQAKYRLMDEFPLWMSELPPSGWSDIGHNYLQLLDGLGYPKARVTDKSLMNYRAAGLIAKTLPQAKMVHVRRDPMDQAFGCYRQNFGSGHLFSYRFEDIANMISDHEKLLRHWQQLLSPDQYYVLDYQALVTDPETEIAGLLAFCDLPDSADCYRPEQTERTVRTLSATQVRQPINQKGLNSWKKYQTQLKPLRDLLDKQGLI